MWQAIEGLPGAEACDKYMFVETYADWADHAKTLKLGAARQARQVSFSQRRCCPSELFSLAAYWQLVPLYHSIFSTWTTS